MPISRHSLLPLPRPLFLNIKTGPIDWKIDTETKLHMENSKIMEKLKIDDDLIDYS